MALPRSCNRLASWLGGRKPSTTGGVSARHNGPRAASAIPARATPMVWPCRYFETHSYRPILKDYFRRGARWTAAPRPQLTNELIDPKFRVPRKGEPISYILTEFEPVFDAAYFFRCGRDLFVIRSNVTNGSGIEWRRRSLGGGD